MGSAAVPHAPRSVVPPLEERPPVPGRLRPGLLLVVESVRPATQASSYPPGDMASGAQLSLTPCLQWSGGPPRGSGRAPAARARTPARKLAVCHASTMALPRDCK
jgi:hypothetical protein